MPTLDVLQKHLQAQDPQADWVIHTVCDKVPGWGFYTGIRKDLRDGQHVSWAVREGVGVVEGSFQALLPDVYRSLRVAEDPGAHGAEVLAMAAVCSLNDGGGLLTDKRASALQRRWSGDPLVGPVVTRSGDTTEVAFLTMNEGAVSRYRVTIDGQYQVTHTKKPYAATPIPR